MEEEKTIDIVVQEYEEKLKAKEKEVEETIARLKEEHAQEIRSIISGRTTPKSEKSTEEEEEEEKDFFTKEIEKTKAKLKIGGKK